MRLWLTKQEIEKIKDERDKIRDECDKMREDKRQTEHRLNVLSCAEHIHFMAHNFQIAGGVGQHDVLFSEDDFYKWAEKANYQPFVHAALDLLVQTGKAKPAETISGQWYIGWFTPSTSGK